MNKYIIKNCPSLGWSKRTFKKCKTYLENNKPCECSEIENCMPKKIYQIVKDFKHNHNSFEQLDKLLENINIEEVNEDSY